MRATSGQAFNNYTSIYMLYSQVNARIRFLAILLFGNNRYVITGSRYIVCATNRMLFNLFCITQWCVHSVCASIKYSTLRMYPDKSWFTQKNALGINCKGSIGYSLRIKAIFVDAIIVYLIFSFFFHKQYSNNEEYFTIFISYNKN